MKRKLITALVVVGACIVSLTTTAPTTSAPSTNSKSPTSMPDSKVAEEPKKKVAVVKSGKGTDSSPDSNNVRKKKSEEFIQFGNQQNKPAGMVDDALSGIASKKNTDMKRQQSYEDGNGPQNGNGDDENEDDGAESDLLSSLMVSNAKADDGGYGDDGESYLGNAAIPIETPLQEDGQSPFRSLRGQMNDRLNGEWFGQEGEFGNRKRRNIVRNDRNFRKRSLRTTAEELMNMRGGARRWKRDVRIREDDVLGFLSLLAAAELAKEKEDTQQRELERLPFPSAESDFDWPIRNRYLDEEQSVDNLGLADNLGYYYPSQSFDVDVISKMMENKESPEIVVFNPDELASIKRSFYPAVDYRSLGIIGARKRRRQQPHELPIGELEEDFSDAPKYSGSWGKIRGSTPNFHQILGDYNQLDDDSDSQDSSESVESVESIYGGHNQQRDRSETEKLYTLGELLNGNSQAEDYRYPVYRRLI